MREKNNVFFQTSNEKQHKLGTNPVITLEIIFDPKTRKRSLTSRLEHCSQYDGKIENTSISFDDAFVLEEAERCLQTSDKTRIHGKGVVKVSTKIWNFVWNVGCRELTEKKDGIISCDLTAKDGVVQSFSYQITDNNEAQGSNELISNDINVRHQNT